MEHQNKNNKSRVSTPSDAEYGPDDILLGRSSTCYKHPGNDRFRRLIAVNAEMYTRHKYSSKERIKLVHCLIGLLQSSGGRFLRYEHDRWREVSMRQVREKVGHALRDAYVCQEVARRKGAQPNRKNEVSTSDQYQPSNTHHNPCLPQHLVPDDTHIFALNKGRNKNSMVPCVRSVLPPSLNNTCLPPPPPPFVSFNPLRCSPGITGGLSVNIPGQQDLPPKIACYYHTAAALTTRPLAAQLLPQQSAAQQLRQMEKHYLRTNIEQTNPSPLHEVGESTRQSPQHLARQQQALSDQPHKTRTAALTNNERIVSLPPSLSKTSPSLPFASSNPPRGSSGFMRRLSVSMSGRHALTPMVPAALTTQPSERQILSQQPVVQQIHHQMELQCNNLRTNIDQTVSLLREVGELTRKHQQQMSRQYRDLAEQLHEQQKKADVPPVIDEKRLPSPWGAQEPSISIKVGNKHTPLGEILRTDTHDSKSNERNQSTSPTNSVEEELEKNSPDIVRPYDVLPGNRKHFGNAFYRSLVAKHGPRYNKGDVKQDRIKEEIVACILHTIHGLGGRFLTVDPIRREFCQQSRIGAKMRVGQALLAERQHYAEPRDTRKWTSPPSSFHTATTTRLGTLFQFAGNESNLSPEHPSSDAPEQHQEDGELTKPYQDQLCQEQQHTLLEQPQAQQTITVAPSATSKKCVPLPWEDQEPSLSIKICTKEQATGVNCSRQRMKKSPKKRITRQLHHPIPDVLSSRSNQHAASPIFCHISEDEGDGPNDEYEDAVLVEMIASAFEQIGNR